VKEERFLKVGMTATISHDLSHTRKSHGVTPEMRKMVGHKYKIDDVWNSAAYGLCARVGGFSWHSKDLITGDQTIEEKEELFHFNTEELNI